MKLSEIREIEENREGSMNVIHLIKEGNFFRAYDWSAWLMVTFLTREKPLKETAKKIKDEYIEVFVGFPESSLSKYIPNNNNFSPISNNQFDITIEAEEIKNYSIDEIRIKVDEWKNSLSLIEKKKTRENLDISEVAQKSVRMSDIINKLISFPLIDKSPKEAFEFLNQLQRQAINLF